MSSPTTDLQLPEGMTALQILKAARDLISVPERWTQYQYAKTELGRTIGASSEGATCWCSIGAIAKVAGLDSPTDATNPNVEQAIWIATHLSGEHFLVTFNDSHTHAEVLDLFDRAIDAAGGSNAQD